MSILLILNNKIFKKDIIKTSDNDNKLITFLNPYSYLLYRNKPLILSKFDVIYIDGILLVYMLRLISLKCYRFSFDMTSLAPIVLKSAAKLNKKLYFIGSKEKEINEFIDNIKAEYPSLDILGYRNGYLIQDKTVDHIVNLNPDIVIAGMGTPFQENFLLQLRDKGWKGTGYTCGGFFHQTAKNINYYPFFFDKLNLRWLYRIIDEPKLLKRYLILYPKSVTLYIFDVISYKINNTK